VSSLVPPDAKNWGDRDLIAVGPGGTVYVVWTHSRASAANMPRMIVSLMRAWWLTYLTVRQARQRAWAGA